ncbi:hypothetical protein EDB85DRAFT_2150031 [Lactarius pseudohatsudake]|nr:hypothetical protein EDB85DRAFT_2150031 [Lactarius pseudohatsudake]
MEAKTITVYHFADLKALRERLQGGHSDPLMSNRLPPVFTTVATIAGLAHVIAQTDDFAIAVSNNFCQWEALVRPVRISVDAAISLVVHEVCIELRAVDASRASQRAAEAWREGSHAELDATRGAARMSARLEPLGRTAR